MKIMEIVWMCMGIMIKHVEYTCKYMFVGIYVYNIKRLNTITMNTWTCVCM